MIVPVALLDYGPRALLAEFGDLDQVMAAAAALRNAPPAGVVDIVPAMRTVLVTFDAAHHVDRDTLVRIWADAVIGQADTAATTVVIPVVYDGVDLGAVAAEVGVGVDEVVRRHHDAEYTVAFCGFMPGFAYLVGLDPALHLPRRSVPRDRVDAGSVAIASEFSGVYPQTSPGGWHLLGRTDVTLWDGDAPTPALLPPGTRVRFEPIERR